MLLLFVIITNDITSLNIYVFSLKVHEFPVFQLRKQIVSQCFKNVTIICYHYKYVYVSIVNDFTL